MSRGMQNHLPQADKPSSSGLNTDDPYAQYLLELHPRMVSGPPSQRWYFTYQNFTELITGDANTRSKLEKYVTEVLEYLDARFPSPVHPDVNAVNDRRRSAIIYYAAKFRKLTSLLTSKDCEVLVAIYYAMYDQQQLVMCRYLPSEIDLLKFCTCSARLDCDLVEVCRENMIGVLASDWAYLMIIALFGVADLRQKQYSLSQEVAEESRVHDTYETYLLTPKPDITAAVLAGRGVDFPFEQFLTIVFSPEGDQRSDIENFIRKNVDYLIPDRFLKYNVPCDESEDLTDERRYAILYYAAIFRHLHTILTDIDRYNLLHRLIEEGMKPGHPITLHRYVPSGIDVRDFLTCPARPKCDIVRDKNRYTLEFFETDWCMMFMMTFRQLLRSPQPQAPKEQPDNASSFLESFAKPMKAATSTAWNWWST